MAAVTAFQLTVAVVVLGDDVKPVGATHITCVTKVALAAAPVPEAQVAVTLQLYELPETSALKLAVVVVCAVDKLVQAEAEFNL